MVAADDELSPLEELLVPIFAAGKWNSESAVARIEGKPQAVMCANHRSGSAVRLSAKPCVVSRWRMWIPIEAICDGPAEDCCQSS
jgi:hypothetical protein